MDDQQYRQSAFRAQSIDGTQRKTKKRNRLPVSCLLCRHQKVKCDRQQPCGRCVKSGATAFCEYGPHAACEPGSKGRPASEIRLKYGIMSRPALQIRLQKLEDLVRSMAAHCSLLHGNALDMPLSTDHSGVEARPDLSTPVNMAGANHIDIRTALSDRDFVGPTYRSSTIQGLGVIRNLIMAETDDADSPSPPASPPYEITTSMVGPQPNITIEQAVARLPPKDKMDLLISTYFRHHFITAPYIHAFKFQREYDGFWVNHSSVNLLWISVLSSILWSAASLACPTGDSLSKSYDAMHLDNLAKLAVECLVADDYLAAKQYSIEALLLCASMGLQRKKNRPSQVWAQSGLLVRLAQRMSYHRDPKYLPNVSPSEGELRRRAWFFIEVFDCFSSFQLGILPNIREDEYDTESPGNLHDLDFDENCNILPPPRPPTEPTSTLYMCIKSELCRKLRRVIIISLSLKPIPYEEVIRLHDVAPRFDARKPPNTFATLPSRSQS